MTERELLLDCLRRLNRTGVAYYLTGSMASNYWGIPRTTHDLDFVVQLPAAAVSRIVEEFSGDFHIDEVAVRAAAAPPHQFNAIDTRSALKVDFWLLGSGPFDQEIFRRRIGVTLFGEPAGRAEGVSLRISILPGGGTLSKMAAPCHARRKLISKERSTTSWIVATARKLALGLIRSRTAVPNAWLARELSLGHASRVNHRGSKRENEILKTVAWLEQRSRF